MKTALVATLERAHALAARFSWVGALLVRISIGLMFFQTGKGKLGNIEGTTGFFESLGIPAPGFHAVFVGGLEMLGGLALVLGLGTRYFAVPLAITMVVAMATGGAFSETPEGLMDVVTASEFTYMVILFWLAATGAGRASLDGLVARVLHGTSRSEADSGEGDRISQGEQAGAAIGRP
ncbi:MAG: DoxX family protein [Deltaproteobacteria bacterium]|nr:DoxX family protein [Deltaproteobacteria bacterium]